MLNASSNLINDLESLSKNIKKISMQVPICVFLIILLVVRLKLKIKKEEQTDLIL